MDKELEMKVKSYLSVADLCKEIQTDMCESHNCDECPLYNFHICSKALGLFGWVDICKNEIRKQK